MPVIVAALVDAIGVAGTSVLAVIGSMSAGQILLWSWRLIRAINSRRS